MGIMFHYNDSQGSNWFKVAMSVLNFGGYLRLITQTFFWIKTVIFGASLESHGPA